jgi:flagellin
LTSEIDRISGSTEFNGTKLLDGSKTNNSFQIGANANQTIDFKIAEVSTKSMSLNSTTALGDLNSGRISAPTVANGMTINGTTIALATADDTAALQATKINAQSGTTGVTATAYNSVQGQAGATGITSGNLEINGKTIAASANMSELVDNINKSADGVTASIGSNGGLSLTNDTGDNISVGANGTSGAGLVQSSTNKGYVSLTSGDGSDIVIGGTDLTGTGFNASTGSDSVSGTGTVTASIDTVANAMLAVNNTAGKGALLATDDIKINGVAVGESGASANEKAAAINAISGQTGVVATADTTAYLSFDAAKAGTFTINGTTVTAATTDDTASLVTKINAAGVAGVTASTDAETGKLKLNAASGTDIVLGSTNAAFITGVNSDASVTAANAIGSGEFMAVRGTVNLTGADGAAVQIEGKAASIAKLGMVAQGGNSEAVGGKLDVSTQANAQSAIARIDSAISFIGTQRSTMGAVQNRLGMAISNLASSSENITSARSRIQDADFATESANLTRGQILQQAGTAMLAQANSLPNGVMALLR